MGLRYININSESVQDVYLFQIFESGAIGGISGVFGNRYLKSDDEIKIIYVNQNNLYEWALMQALPHSDFKEKNEFILEDVLITSNNNEIGYAPLVHLNRSDNLLQKTELSLLCRHNKKMNLEISKNVDYMNKHKPEQYTSTSNFTCDRHDKKNFSVHHGDHKFYVRMGIVVEKVHSTISNKQSFLLKKYSDFCSARRASSKTDFKINFYKV